MRTLLKALFLGIFLVTFSPIATASLWEMNSEILFYRTEQALVLNHTQLNNAWELLFGYGHCTGAKQTLEMALPIAKRHRFGQNLELIEAGLKEIEEMQEDGRCRE